MYHTISFRVYMLVAVATLALLCSLPAYAQEEGTTASPETTSVQPATTRPQPKVFENIPLLNRDRVGQENTPGASTTNSIRARLEMQKKALEERRENVQDKISDVRDRFTQRKEELREDAKERIRAYFTRTIHRLTAAVERLESIADRVGSRIEKLKERGVDVRQAVTLLETADAKIAEAKTMLSSLGNSITDALSANEMVREKVQAVQEIIKKAKQSVMDAHKALVEAIAALRSASPTPSTSDSSDTDE